MLNKFTTLGAHILVSLIFEFSSKLMYNPHILILVYDLAIAIKDGQQVSRKITYTSASQLCVSFGASTVR